MKNLKPQGYWCGNNLVRVHSLTPYLPNHPAKPSPCLYQVLLGHHVYGVSSNDLRPNSSLMFGNFKAYSLRRGIVDSKASKE